MTFAEFRDIRFDARLIPPSARLMVSSSRSVIFDIADTTMATGRCLCCSSDRRAATCIRSAEPTLVPPKLHHEYVVHTLSAVNQGSIAVG